MKKNWRQRNHEREREREKIGEKPDDNENRILN